MQTAKRLDDIGEYYFSQKLRKIDEMNKAGKQVINLGIANPVLTPKPLLQPIAWGGTCHCPCYF